MDDDDQEMFETTEEEDFSELLEQSFVKPHRLTPGQKAKMKIIKVTAEWIFLDLGGKSEGYLATREFLDEDSKPTVREGDLIEAYFLSANNNEQLFTTKISGGEAARNYIEEAWRSSIPVEGMVEKEIKGGFEVKIAGGLRGFCPYSQMGLQRVDDASQYIGQKVSFKISEYGEKGRNLVLSNRAILEEERQRRKEALKSSLREGMTVKGTVTSIRDFGAFVDIGGVDGLLPVSEIGWGHVEDIRQALSVGEEVEVVILKLDWEKERVSFSLKRTLPDPWETIEQHCPEGSKHQGKVVRLTNFGAFVSLPVGVEGLLHISRLGEGRKIRHPRDVLTEGQMLQVRIDQLDKAAKRLSLSIAGDDEDEEQVSGREGSRQFAGEATGSMGTLGDLMKAKLAKKTK